tara:strand:+ start:1348 stop:2721 length:1374 start_codon:yes stop_codon:yes gene_type:complete
VKKKSYNIAVFVRDQEYLDQIEQYLEKSYKNIENITITYISEHKLKSKHNLINLNSYYDEVNIPQSEKEFYDSLDNKYWKNKKIYKADPRYVTNIKNITWIDQCKLIYSCRKIYEEKSFDLILMGGAAYLFWIVPQLVALEKNILSYKLFFFDYINPYFDGIRLWFCTDPFWDIDINSSYDFKWEKSKARNHIKDLKKSIIEDDFNLDAIALTLREDFTPKKLNNIIKNILKSLLSKDNLGPKRLKASIEARKNQKLYIDFDNLPEKFLLFPLNQPVDEQLLLRAPGFEDNYKNLLYVLENLSKDITLIVKEHPVNPGMIEAKLIKKLMSDYNNVYFISPSIPLRKILRKSQGLITINSTSGLESLLINKNVLALGMGYYKKLNSVYTVDNHPVKDVLESMSEEKSIVDPVEIDFLLEKILNQTFPEPGKYPDKKLEIDKTMSEAFYYKIKQLKSQS